MIFEVLGLPATKGSVRSFVNRKTGRVVSLSDNPRLKGWEAAVAWSARAAGARPGLEPAVARMEFRLPRPKGHLGKGGAVKASAPLVPTTKPDIDKLVRAVLDGLTGVAFVDDSQVVEVAASKRYCAEGEAPGVVVSLA